MSCTKPPCVPTKQRAHEDPIPEINGGIDTAMVQTNALVKVLMNDAGLTKVQAQKAVTVIQNLG